MRKRRWPVGFLVLFAGTTLLGLLARRQELTLDVGHNAAAGKGSVRKQFVQLFVVLDGQGDVAIDDALAFVFFGAVSGQFEHFGVDVLQHCSQKDGRGFADARLFAQLLFHETTRASSWIDETGSVDSFLFGRHDECDNN